MELECYGPGPQHAWGETDVEFAPAGNYLAHGLRNIYDDTGSIFGRSVYSTEEGRVDRWRSLVTKDFNIKDIREAFIRGKKPKTSLPFNETEGYTEKKFMQWRVPHRLIEDGDPRSGVVSRVAIVRSSCPSKLPNSARAAEQDMPSLPAIPSANRAEVLAVHPSVRAKHRTPSARTPSIPSEAGYSRSPSAPVKPSKINRKNQLLHSYASHNIPTVADQMLRNANTAERDQIKQALRIGENMGKPVAVENVVGKWASNATERDRRVALDFFKSIAGARLLGDDDEKAEKVVKELQRTGRMSMTARPALDCDEQSRLRYIRLLTPNTRRNKEMHQTWHHLPSYKNDNTVMNNSGIYNSASAYMPRHYSIHPDWG